MTSYIRKKYRLSIRNALIELGRKCNFKCRHCYQGESKDVAITPEVVEALCDNVLWIDELRFVGGEPMLYVDELRMILEIFKKRRIKVNYLGIITNMSMQSQEFADVYNDWADYITYPDKSGIEVSIDPFHLDFITKSQIEKNIAFYREKCPSLKAKERIGVYDNTMEKCIVMVGRAKNWTAEEIAECHIVESPPQSLTPKYEVMINKKCLGENGNEFNLCGYKCVKNCAFYDRAFVLYCDGSFSNESILNLEDAQRSGFIIGNIITDRLYDSVNEFNNKCKSLPENSISGRRTIWLDRDAMLETIINETNKTLYLAIFGNLDDAEEHIVNAINHLEAMTNYSDIRMLFDKDNESLIEEELRNATQEELDALEQCPITRGITTSETRAEFRSNYDWLHDRLDEIYNNIQEMKKKKA